MKQDNIESTLFMIEVKHSTWYVDYNNETGKYNVCKDEKFRCQRASLGEALAYIFNTLGTTTLKAIYK